LPTEAEWEYACRAGTSTKYSFGGGESQLEDYAWFYLNTWNIGERYAHRVGLKKPNPFGLYDMHGNVWEWCSDRYGDYPKGAVTDPIGPAEGFNRVKRGASWLYEAARCESAYRVGDTPGNRDLYNGFRVALSSSGIPK
jgi:formylglycine-generating enzyme required for sulfatase activity